jgi:hypothetical protein
MREALIELWAQVFERELRADLEADSVAERARLARIEAAPLRLECADDGRLDVEQHPRRQP